MPVYPVFLDLTGRTAVVVGGGSVGSRKARGLAAAGTTVRVVDPKPSPDLAELAGIELVRRTFRPNDLDGAVLVYACTPDAAVNADVLAAADARGIPACDSGTGLAGPGGLTFTGGATLRSGDVCIAVSTGGASPALAARLRDRIAEALGADFAGADEETNRCTR